jgi:hypothetical protein
MRGNRGSPLSCGDVEVVRTAEALFDQLRPGHGSTKYVRLPKLQQSPILVMRSERALHEPDSVALFDDADSEVDILDAGLGEALIEPVKRPEGIRPDRTEAAPEREGLASAMLVNPMMTEVRIQGSQTPRFRVIVVRTEAGNYFTQEDWSFELTERVRMNHNVSIHEDDDRSSCGVGADVPPPRRTSPRRSFSNDGRAGGSSDLRGAVRRSIVEDDDLVRRTMRTMQRVQTIADGIFRVVCGDYDGQRAFRLLAPGAHSAASDVAGTLGAA